MSQPNIAAYESGARRPGARTMARIEAACRTRPSAALRAHREDLLRLASEHRVRDVRVFGSVARRADTLDSDLDLLVRFPDDASLLDLVRFADAVEECLGVRVDVISEGGLDDRSRSIRAQAVPV